MGKSKPKPNKLLICRDINGKKHKRPLKEYRFRPGIYGIIIKGGKILLSPQWDGYDFPGGGVEIDETLDNAFSREIREETGLAAQRGEVIVAESSFFLGVFSKQPWNSVNIYCLARKFKGKITDKYFDENEKKYAKKAEWVSLKKANKIKFYNSASDSLEIIKKALMMMENR